MRWKIETFHEILKSGCNAEECRLRTVERLTNLIAVFCILSWRIFWFTMLGRPAPQATAELAFTHTEIELLAHIVHNTPHNARTPPLVRNVIRLAQLGGYLGRTNEPPPGNTVMWRRMWRLTEIQIGYELALKRSG